MNFTKMLQLTTQQTLGTTEPVELLGVYDATPFGCKERIGTTYLVENAYGDQIRVKVLYVAPVVTKEMFAEYKAAEITPLVKFVGLIGRVSTDKNGNPILCGTAEKVALVSPLPPSRLETISKFFEDPIGEEP